MISIQCYGLALATTSWHPLSTWKGKLGTPSDAPGALLTPIPPSRSLPPAHGLRSMKITLQAQFSVRLERQLGTLANGFTALLIDGGELVLTEGSYLVARRYLNLQGVTVVALSPNWVLLAPARGLTAT